MTVYLHQVIQLAVNLPEDTTDYYTKLHGIFTCGSTTLAIPTFCKGNGQWAIHFSPNCVGQWSYILPDGQSGVLDCISGGREGLAPLSVGQMQGRSIFKEGEKPHFQTTYECDWLFALWMSDRAGAERMIEAICAQKFNGVVFNFYAHECSWTDPATPGRQVPPPVYIWGGSNDNPNFDVLNENFYSQLDELFFFLQQKNLYAYVYYFVYNKSVSYPPQGSDQERMYIQQSCARYQAFPNVVWVYGKEVYLNPQKEIIIENLEFIAQTDGYHRLLTFQDDKKLMEDARALAVTDFFMLQQHTDFYEYTKNLAWLGDRPVFHSEFGYEAGASLDDITYNEAQSIREFLMRAWTVAFAGAGICYYYTFTGWDVIRPDDNPPGYAMFKTLNEYFMALDWWNFVPRPDLMLWTPGHCLKRVDGEECIFITNHRGKILVDYDITTTKFTGSWLNPFTGETVPLSADHTMVSECNDLATILTSPFEKNDVDDYAILRVSMS